MGGTDRCHADRVQWPAGDGIGDRIPAFAGFFHAELQRPKHGGEAEQQGEIGHVVDQAIGQHFLALIRSRRDDGDENQVSKSGAIGHHERAEGSAFQAVFKQRLEAPDHQQRRAQKKREIDPDAREPEDVDGVRERIHARPASRR